MTSTRSAADTGWPNPRRTFLRQLASLPLIGGGVSLIGSPVAVAEPITDDLLWGYKEWLHFEHRMLSYELAGHDYETGKQIRGYFPHTGKNHFGDWHFQWSKEGARGPAGWIDAPQPSTRAALVLSAVGCDWRETQR